MHPALKPSRYPLPPYDTPHPKAPGPTKPQRPGRRLRLSAHPKPPTPVGVRSPRSPLRPAAAADPRFGPRLTRQQRRQDARLLPGSLRVQLWLQHPRRRRRGRRLHAEVSVPRDAALRRRDRIVRGKPGGLMRGTRQLFTSNYCLVSGARPGRISNWGTISEAP